MLMRDFKAEYCEQARKLCRLGATVPEIANFFNVGQPTLRRWCLENDEFRLAIKAGKEEADERVREALYQRALGWECEEVFVHKAGREIIQTKVPKRYPPDVLACIFWLKNRRPEEWRDVKPTDYTGVANQHHATEMSEGELERIAKDSGSGTATTTPKSQQSDPVH